MSHGHESTGAADERTPSGSQSPPPGTVSARSMGMEPTTTREALARRTWELELLISGAVVFALIKVPGTLAGAFERHTNYLDEGWQLVAVLFYTYLQLGIGCMIVALVVHLITRALWVGLIGLDAVFPGGIRWRQLTSFGPRVQSFYRVRLPRMRRQIDGLDAFCNTIFSIAFALTLVFLSSILLVGPFAVVAAVIDRFFFDSEFSLLRLYTVILLPLVPMVIAVLLDRRLAQRPGKNRLRSFVHAAYRPYYYAIGGPIYPTISFTLWSNVKKRTYWLGFVGIFSLLVGLFLISTSISAGILGWHGWRFAPAHPSSREMVNEHYENLRDPEGVYGGPSIERDVVKGPYLRLFLPYLPHVHNDQIEALCPTLEPLQRDGLIVHRRRFLPQDSAAEAAVGKAIRCLAGLWTIDLDGEPIDASSFDFFRHPQTGQVGLVGYLPMAERAVGRHALRLQSRGEPGDDEEDLRIRVIPFWR